MTDYEYETPADGENTEVNAHAQRILDTDGDGSDDTTSLADISREVITSDDVTINTNYRVLPVLSLPIVPTPALPQEVAAHIIRVMRRNYGIWLIRWQGSWLVYRTGSEGSPGTGGRYVRVNEADDAEVVRQWLMLSLRTSRYRTTDRDGTVEEVLWNPVVKRVSEVEAALKAFLTVSADFPGGHWVDDLEEQLHPSENIIVCRNGLLTYEFDGTRVCGSLLPHDQRFISEIGVDVTYDPEAECPTWHSFLHSVWEKDPLSIDTLQELMGMLLQRDVPQVEKLFLLFGKPRSGKGTIARIIEALQGGPKCVDHPTVSRLAGPFGLAPALGKRVAIVGDSRTMTTPAAIETLLGISGNDTMSVNRKNKSELQVKLPMHIIIMSNEKPKMHDSSGAIASRFIPIRTQGTFLGREDLTLGTRLLDELSGILNWCLEGLARLRANGYRFTLSPVSNVALTELDESFSPMKVFASEYNVIEDALGGVDRNELFGLWESWCLMQRENPGTRKKFIADLQAVFPDVREARRSIDGKQYWYCLGITRNATQ